MDERDSRKIIIEDDDTEYSVSHPKTILDELARQLFEEDIDILHGFNNKHPDYYIELILRTQEFLPHYAAIKERFWHIYHQTEEKPICILEGCVQPVKWLSLIHI